MKKIIVFFLLAIYYLSADKNTVVAQYGQYGQYGQPSPSYYILIDKFVGKPSFEKDAKNYKYVDNLSPSDPRFRPGQEIFFKIKVKNTSINKLTNVIVKDHVPSYLEPIEGPGNWDTNSRVISWNAGDFEVGEEKVYYAKMQVYPQDKLPTDKGLFCLVNKAVAYSENKASDEDTTQFCVEKEVLGTSKIPSAGPEMGALFIFGNILTAGFGLWLKNLTTKN